AIGDCDINQSSALYASLFIWIHLSYGLFLRLSCSSFSCLISSSICLFLASKLIELGFLGSVFSCTCNSDIRILSHIYYICYLYVSFIIRLVSFLLLLTA